jgi:hypothetical protein
MRSATPLFPVRVVHVGRWLELEAERQVEFSIRFDVGDPCRLTGGKHRASDVAFDAAAPKRW